MRYLYLTFTLLLFFELTASSQEFEWVAGFDGFLDNREYFSIDVPQTIFGARMKGGIGASIADAHRIRFGLDYLYEFGSETDAHLPDITLYYQYTKDGLNFQLGAFPRKRLLNYPIALLSDTLRYYRPNMEGVYLATAWEWGTQNVFIDWTSRQTEDAPERFIFGFSGQLHKGILFLNHHLVMGHFAGKGIPEPDYHLRDNGGFDVNLGLDLSEKTPIDSLHLSTGTLVSLDRIRGVDDGWQTPAGFVGQFSAFHRWVGIDGRYYQGKGHTFLYGDPFYRLRHYGRVDLYVMPFHNNNVRLKINFVLHFAKGEIDYSQQILVSMNLNGSRPFRNNK